MAQIYQKKVTPFRAGCGSRRVGKVYLHTNLKEHLKHHPLSYFIFDPPHLVEDPAAWGLSAQGISYIEKGGVWHALDWIGQSFYHNAADLWEEAAAFEASGLVPLTSQIAKLEPGKSRRLLFFPNGYLMNPRPYRMAYQDHAKMPPCLLPPESPGYQEHLNNPDQMCAALWWQVIEKGKGEKGSRSVVRQVGDTTYQGFAPLESDPPEYALALGGWLPIDALDLVVGEDPNSNPPEVKDQIKEALQKLKEMSQLPIYLSNA